MKTKHILQNIGLLMFIIGLLIFTSLPGIGYYQISTNEVAFKSEFHQNAIAEIADQSRQADQKISSTFVFIKRVTDLIKSAQQELSTNFDGNLPDGKGEWDVKIADWDVEYYVSEIVQSSASGPIQNNPWLWFMLTFGLSILGGLLYMIPKFYEQEGIKHDGIFHNSFTRGLKLTVRSVFLGVVIIGIITYGILKLQDFLWPAITLLLIGVIYYLVFYKQNARNHNPPKSASPIHTGWLGVIAGTYLIFFYILLYWAPNYINNWIDMVDPISKALSGNEASNWFLYGLMYTIIVAVMGIRMWSKYRHNRYQKIRTASVVFFQTAFAFLIPEILVRLNQPWFDFKNIWPLDYDFFFDYNLNTLVSSGGLGLFMLVWGIVLIVIAVPVITYFYGKRWYCSWVCGCGGLAETMGDPFRQLSDKSLRAWKWERYIIHGVLAFAILMTAMVLYTYFTGAGNILFINSYSMRSWYGFFIGAGFSGVVGTGFYPLMGNRVWCRFGCPLAAYLGLVQRFKSRFRITTNGGQCISCGNCSTYCEMGIDVRAYAQNIVRSSCVGCGVCAAVCPRGVLRLENGPNTDSSRTAEQKVIHIVEGELRIL